MSPSPSYLTRVYYMEENTAANDGFLSRDNILEAKDHTMVVVDVPDVLPVD